MGGMAAAMAAKPGIGARMKDTVTTSRVSGNFRYPQLGFMPFLKSWGGNGLQESPIVVFVILS